MTSLPEGSIHGCSDFQNAIIEEDDEDLMGCSSRRTMEEDDGKELDISMPDSSSSSSASVVGVLHVESRNIETTPVRNSLGDLQPGHQRRSKFYDPACFTSPPFHDDIDDSGYITRSRYGGTNNYAKEAEMFARRRSTTFLRNIDFVQEQTTESLSKSNAFQNSVKKEAEMFARRRSTTFLKNIDFVQGQTESISQSSAEILVQNVDFKSAEELARSSANKIASSVDLVQEQAERVTRDFGSSITNSVDYAQEQAEMFTKFLATSVFGQLPNTTTAEATSSSTRNEDTLTSSTSTQEGKSTTMKREKALKKRDSIMDFVERRVDTFTRNVKHVEVALLQPQ